MGYLRFIGAFTLLMCSISVHAQSAFYDLGTIQKIEIYFSVSNWDYQMDTAKSGAEGYIMADWVKVNGVQFDSVGVKYKGNSSYNANNAKNPLHIALDEFKNQDYQGIEDIKLSNGFSDPTYIREVLSYHILENYMECPRSNFAQVYINGAYVGVYSNSESINKDFCSERFGSSTGTLVKCNPTLNPSPSNKSNLKYITTGDSSAYMNYYEIKSDYGWNALRALCDSVTNNATASLDRNIDVDRAIWMLAFNNVFVNLDSYSGAFCQNYYLYKDGTQRFNPIIWDLNMCFGGFPNVGSGNSSMGSLSLTAMQQMAPSIHATDPYWPLIVAIQSNPMYKRMYNAHLKTIASEMLAGSVIEDMAGSLRAIVDTAVQSDANGFYSYSQFQNALTTNIQAGPFQIPGLTNLTAGRFSYLQTTTEWNLNAPVISNVGNGPNVIQLNGPLNVIANVTGASAVYLGYRSSINDRFVRIPMYDDGAHEDGSAGDGIYGVSVTMQSLICQYYIYAENADAGMFSPQRAEHEFYSATAISGTSDVAVVINEVLTSNSNGATDEVGELEDWIELYNPSADAIDLSGMYLTDNPLNLDKWEFPQGSVIGPDSYYIIWADEDSSQGIRHANFKLSAAGETLYLLDAELQFVDSLSWGIQTANRSLARIPNGTGPFVDSEPSFNAFNPEANSVASIAVPSLKAWPNPVQDAVFVWTPEQGIRQWELYDLQGKLHQKGTMMNQVRIDTQELKAGMYVYRSEGAVIRIVVQH